MSSVGLAWLLRVFRAQAGMRRAGIRPVGAVIGAQTVSVGLIEGW